MKSIPGKKDIINPKHLILLCKLYGTDIDDRTSINDMKDQFVEFYTLLYEEGKQPVRIRGHEYSYMFDRDNWHVVRTSDGGEIVLSFVSDLIDYASEVAEVLADASYCHVVSIFTTGDVDQQEHEIQNINEPPEYKFS